MDIISLTATERNGQPYSRTIIVDTSMIARVIRDNGSDRSVYLHEHQNRNESTPFVTEYKVSETLSEIESRAMDIVNVAVESFAGTDTSTSPVNMGVPIGLIREVAKENSTGKMEFAVSEQGATSTYTVSESASQVMSKVQSLTSSFGTINISDKASFDTGSNTTTEIDEDGVTRDGSGTETWTFDNPSGTAELRADQVSLDGGTTSIDASELNLLDGMSKTGADTQFVTGTAGTDGNVPQFNADGDIVDTSVVASNIVQSDDADASSYSWVLDEDDMASNSSTALATQQSIRQYVESNLEGLRVKSSVKIASTGNIDLSSNTEPGAIDGSGISDGDRILLKNQTTASENGVYITNTALDPSTWTRAEDFDEDGDVFGGVAVFVNEGTTNKDTRWVITTNDPITVGTTDITFSKFSGTGQITGGDMISKSGDTLDLDIASGSQVSAASGDELAFADVSNSNAIRKDTISNILSLYDTQTATLFNKTLDNPTLLETIYFDDGSGTTRISTGTTNGTKIGISASEMIAFFGGTPVAQQSALTESDPSTVDTTYGQEEADVINNLRTRVNELEARLQSYALLPTP